jgi:hypothetical protein
MEKEKVDNNTGQTGPGLTPDQVQADIDSWTAKKVQVEQEKIMIEFDKNNFQSTIERKIRMNGRSLKLVNSNIEVLKKDLEEAKEIEPRTEVEAKTEAK